MVKHVINLLGPGCLLHGLFGACQLNHLESRLAPAARIDKPSIYIAAARPEEMISLVLESLYCSNTQHAPLGESCKVDL